MSCERCKDLETEIESTREELDAARETCRDEHVDREDFALLEDAASSIPGEMRGDIHRFKYRSTASHPTVSELIEAMEAWERELESSIPD